MTAPATVSPDGARLCLVVRHGERRDLWVMAADGTGSRRIGESLARSYQGEMDCRYGDGEDSVRVIWAR